MEGIFFIQIQNNDQNTPKIIFLQPFYNPLINMIINYTTQWDLKSHPPEWAVYGRSPENSGGGLLQADSSPILGTHKIPINRDF